MSEGCGIVGVVPTAKALSDWLVQFDTAASVVDTCDIVRHEVDCQLYGSMFRTHCNDPLTDVMIALSIPTDCRTYIEKQLYDAVDALLQSTVGAPQWNHIYVVEWISQGTGVIKWWPDPPVRHAIAPTHNSGWGHA